MIVLDSSVTLKWIFDDEEGHGKAVRYRSMHISGELSVVVPGLFFYEVANVLSTKSRLNKTEAAEAFSLFWNFDFEVFHFRKEDFLSLMEIASFYRVTAYDAAYIELARRMRCDFVTADRKLFEKVRSLKFVRLL